MTVLALRLTALSAALLTTFARPALASPAEGRLVVSAFPVVADRLSTNLGLGARFGPGIAQAVWRF